MDNEPKHECETCGGPLVRLSFCPDCQTTPLALPLHVTDTNFSNCECRLEDSRPFVIARVYERKHADAKAPSR